MEDYAGQVLADRYRLPNSPADGAESFEFGLVESAALDTYSGQEVLLRQVPLPEVVNAEFIGGGAAPDILGMADDPAARALAAARAAARIADHPRLVQVFDVFLDNGSLWVVTELVPALPLAAVIAEKPLTPYRAAEIGADVLGALSVVHSQGWAHRNVTPHTVLVCDDGRAMVTGMCVAAAEEALCGSSPPPNFGEGTPAGPPAQVAGSMAGVAAGSSVESGASGDAGEVGCIPPGTATTPLAPVDPAAPARPGPSRKRSRQARIDLVGAVTERWSPEQAGDIGQVGPATDLWALGVLLYRSVQGYGPFPEESPTQLVEVIRTEPPAFAEECGPLRPVVESLLRKDPTERPDGEELRGWLRSLVRSAPEPDVGRHTVAVPADPVRVPMVRDRGEVERHSPAPLPAIRGKHARGRTSRWRPGRLGLLLLGLVVLLVAAALLVAVRFLPRSDAEEAGGGGGNNALSALDLSGDFTVRHDPEGFSIAVPAGWQRAANTGGGAVHFAGGDNTMIVVPGRDKTRDYGDAPLAYQNDREPELASFRAAVEYTFYPRSVSLGGDPAAEAKASWQDADGEETYARNLAVRHDGGYYVIYVCGPGERSADVDRVFEKAAESFRFG